MNAQNHNQLSRAKAPKYFLSVAVVSYNHSKYIKQALNSILMQNLDCAYEIIIGDDCSTDETQEIIKEYHKQYPDMIKPILRKNNIGPTKNLYDVLLNCSGKYIAILEGDDFWTDPNKLRLQTDFLENNNSYAACTHRYSVVDEENNIIQESYMGPGRPQDGIYSINDFENYIYFGHLGTLVFRNIILQPKHDYSIISSAHNFVSDMTICVILCCLGDVFVLSENMMSYRSMQVEGGTNYCSTIAKTNLMLERYDYLKKLENYCKNEMNCKLKHTDRMLYYTWWSVLYVVRFPSKHNWMCLRKFHELSNNKIKLYGYIGIKLFELPIMIINYLKKKMRIKSIINQTKIEKI